MWIVYSQPKIRSLTTPSIFPSYSVCTTIAWDTLGWISKFVDEVGSTGFYRNYVWVLTAIKSITKADRPKNFTIFHCRMSTIQPAWPVCTTTVCWHMCCWHFCSRSSLKTIPSLKELVVTQTVSCFVTYLSIGISQVFIMMARIGYKVKWKLQ